MRCYVCGREGSFVEIIGPEQNQGLCTPGPARDVCYQIYTVPEYTKVCYTIVYVPEASTLSADRKP